jgi:hypothetical protein
MLAPNSFQEAFMIKIKLTRANRIELNKFRYQAPSRDSEKALMVLMNADGQSVADISSLLRRNPHIPSGSGSSVTTHMDYPVYPENFHRAGLLHIRRNTIRLNCFENGSSQKSMVFQHLLELTN